MGSLNNKLQMSRTALGDDKKKNVFTALADNTKTESPKKEDIEKPQYLMRKELRKSGIRLDNSKTSPEYKKQIDKEYSGNGSLYLSKKETNATLPKQNVLRYLSKKGYKKNN